jgi:Heparan-alpha-glucosaminide N-acetyltransferase, catalytic
VNAPARLAGVDVARGLALIGMMTVHVLPGPVDGGADPVATAAYRLAEGRSAALFAVLAGVSLVLARATREQIAVRALVVAAIGLTLGVIQGPIAVILTCYGLLFLLALPFLRLPAGALAGLALGWAVLSPLASQWLRGAGLDAPPANPSWGGLFRPTDFLQNLLLTGYYPALTWLTYLLAGLAAGKLLLGRDPQTAARSGRWFAAAGAGVALAGWLCGVVVVRLAGGVEGLNRLLDPGALVELRGERLLQETFYGTTPLTSWWWVGVPAPHSGSIADLLQTAGSALLALGLALVASQRIRAWLAPLAAAGAITLTLYTLHVLVMSSIPRDAARDWPLLLIQVGAALLFATVTGAPKRRGPLEEFVAGSVRTLTRTRP